MTVAPDKMELELPPAPRSLWDFLNVLTPVIKYYVALLVLFLGARWFNRQLDNETKAQEQETQRPVLSPELTIESSEEEEEIEELITDGDRLVSLDTKKSQKKTNTTKELFDGLRKVEQELRDKKAVKDTDDSVSWNELHSSMLRRYQDKYTTKICSAVAKGASHKKHVNFGQIAHSGLVGRKAPAMIETTATRVVQMTHFMVRRKVLRSCNSTRYK